MPINYSSPQTKASVTVSLFAVFMWPGQLTSGERIAVKLGEAQHVRSVPFHPTGAAKGCVRLLGECSPASSQRLWSLTQARRCLRGLITGKSSDLVHILKKKIPLACLSASKENN